MLERPGDLIPVNVDAASVPWTRRRSQILDFLHRGPVDFETLVYDTNVGDISSLVSYFNPERVSVDDLNTKIGSYPSSGDIHVEVKKIGNEEVVMPRLLLYSAERTDYNEGKDRLNVTEASNQALNQRTFNWVMEQKLKAQADSVKHETEKGQSSKVGEHKLLGKRLYALRSRSSTISETTSSDSTDELSLEALSLEVGPSVPKTISNLESKSGNWEVSNNSSTEPDLATALDMVSRALRDGTFNLETPLPRLW